MMGESHVECAPTFSSVEFIYILTLFGSSGMARC